MTCPVCDRLLDYIYTPFVIRSYCPDCDLVIVLNISMKYHEGITQMPYQGYTPRSKLELYKRKQIY